MNNESNKIREKIENSNISIEQKRIYTAITPTIFSDSDTVDLDKLVSTIESLLEKERGKARIEILSDKLDFIKGIQKYCQEPNSTVFKINKYLDHRRKKYQKLLTSKEGEVK